MKKPQLTALCALAVVIVSTIGCLSTRASFINILKEENANFILYISNQSLKEPLVDIKVVIDGRTVADDEFEVKNQHHWKMCSLNLVPGEHTLHAQAANGIIEINRSFTVTGKNWAVLSFWGSKTKVGVSEMKGLTFEIYDQPIGFL